MKFFNKIKISAIMILLLTSYGAMAQTDDKNPDVWVKSKTWAPNLKINIYADVNSAEFKHQYENNKTTWDKVFAFLADSAKLASLPAGTYPIEDKNAYAIITEAPSKTPEAAKWEAHRKYIDLQYVIRGEEKIGVAPLGSATVTEPYDEKKDSAHYTADGKYYTATPSEFYLFFPSDAHRPNLKVDGFDVVKKLVIKIMYVQ
jgi:biofilm protein TabA